ncbi:hypothetical protein LTS15_011216 [Exophiala xenobiotica]|nr:hypothetical protein LTS15_011216 [Exophiala xenobiotica]
MLPLGLLTAAQGHPMLVELKNGETLNGHLVNCDTWMNLTLKEVVQTSPEGDRFWRLPEVYVRGNNFGRSNTYECPRKSSKWPENNNKISKVVTVNVVAVVNSVGIKVAGVIEDAVEAGGVAEEEVRADYRLPRSKVLLSSPPKPQRPFWWHYNGFQQN